MPSFLSHVMGPLGEPWHFLFFGEKAGFARPWCLGLCLVGVAVGGAGHRAGAPAALEGARPHGGSARGEAGAGHLHVAARDTGRAVWPGTPALRCRPGRAPVWLHDGADQAPGHRRGGGAGCLQVHARARCAAQPSGARQAGAHHAAGRAQGRPGGPGGLRRGCLHPVAADLGLLGGGSSSCARWTRSRCPGRQQHRRGADARQAGAGERGPGRQGARGGAPVGRRGSHGRGGRGGGGAQAGARGGARGGRGLRAGRAHPRL